MAIPKHNLAEVFAQFQLKFIDEISVHLLEETALSYSLTVYEILFEFLFLCQSDLRTRSDFLLTQDQIRKFISDAINGKDKGQLKTFIDPPDYTGPVGNVSVANTKIATWLELWLRTHPTNFKIVSALITNPETEVTNLHAVFGEFHSGNFYQALRKSGLHYYLVELREQGRSYK